MNIYKRYDDFIRDVKINPFLPMCIMYEDKRFIGGNDTYVLIVKDRQEAKETWEYIISSIARSYNFSMRNASLDINFFMDKIRVILYDENDYKIVDEYFDLCCVSYNDLCSLFA